VAHTVGPVYSKTNPEKSAKLLESCYRTSLELAAKHEATSIGFSSISTGIYGYPIVDATRIALETTRRFLEENETVSGRGGPMLYGFAVTMPSSAISRIQEQD
jgi:O-acetyl-ADP-ribose deacetylase (regulator of RNase III)